MKKLLLSICFVAFTFGAYAQSINVVEYNGRYITNRFWSNWFIQGGVGGNVFLGGQNEGGLGRRTTPVFDIAVGRWMTPSIGFRVQYNGSYMREYSASYTSPYAQWGKAANGLALQKFNYMNLHGDILWNLSTALGGYRSDRLFELVPYTGFGFGLASYDKAPDNYEIGVNFGLINKFRVSRSVDINLELRSSIFNGRFDNSTINNRFDVPVAATVGVTYRFGRTRTFTRAADIIIIPAPVVVDNTALNNARAALAEQEALNKKLADELAAAKNRKPQVVEVVKGDYAELPMFFGLGQTTLDAKGIKALDAIAEMIKSNPNQKFVVEAYADKQTGTPARNKVITEQRAKYIYDQLVSRGVKASQITTVANGGGDLPYGVEELNRVSIVK